MYCMSTYDVLGQKLPPEAREEYQRRLSTSRVPYDADRMDNEQMENNAKDQGPG